MKVSTSFFILVSLFLLNFSPLRIAAQTPTIVYPSLLTEYATGDAIDFSVDVYSNGLIDQLCAVRYSVFKDDMVNPIASVASYGTISYTVRGQGSNYVTTPIADGQGLLSIEAMSDTLYAFTLGVFDNYCVNRDRPINIDMNFSVPGNYRFVIEIVSCSNDGISTGTTYTASSCDGMVHTDSVSDTCLTPVVLNTYSIDFKVCGESTVTKLTGDANYIAGDSVEFVFSLGEFDDSVHFNDLPSWLVYNLDNVAHELTLSGVAPALQGTQEYFFHFATTSTLNPASCYHAFYGQSVFVKAPIITFSPIDSVAVTGAGLTSTVEVNSNTLVDELCGVRYAIYKDNSTTPIDNVDNYGSVSCIFRGQGTTMVENDIHDGAGFIEFELSTDTVRAFTLGVFDNFCIDRDRPIELHMSFIIPGEYRFEAELVSCANQGISTGTTFTAIYCDGQVHTDSVAEYCNNPAVLTSESVDVTICGFSEINFESGSVSYEPGDSINFVYLIGGFDDLIGDSEIPEWLTYAVDTINDLLTFTGIAPATNGNNTFSFQVSSAASANPSSCPADTTVVNILVNAPSVEYSQVDTMYTTSENITTTARVYSNGFVDELCGIRYAIYKDSSSTPIANVADYGSISYTVRGQGAAMITTPILNGQGNLEVYALSDTLQAFTLGIFDNYCLDRDRPINVEMNFNVPGKYRFEAELVSCSNPGISTGTTFTDISCGGTNHTDSVALSCVNPNVLCSESITSTICSESSIAYVSGPTTYFPGQSISILYSVGDYDDGVELTGLPTWLNFDADTANHTITLVGTAPAFDAMNLTYNFTLTTSSTQNPNTCPTASTASAITILQGPEIIYTPLVPVYQTGDSIFSTGHIYSHGYVDELSAVRYGVYRNATLIDTISNYGAIEYSVRVSGTTYDTTAIETGSGFVTMKPAADTLSAFTLGIFDNSCVNRNRPVDLYLNFSYPGNYTFNSEIVSCSNTGTALGSSFVATNCDNLTHFDSVAQTCTSPVMLYAESIGFTICAGSEISYASGQTSYCAGSTIDLVYNVGDFDDGIDASSLPAWVSYSANTANHTISLHGTVPAYDAMNPTYTLNLATTSTENPVTCPTASLVQVVSVKETYNDTITESICEGDSIEMNGVSYNTTGIYPNTLTAVNGCDSIVVLDLTVMPTLYNEFIATADSVYVWNTIQYTVTGDYTQTLVSAAGCDSIVTMHLTITIGFDELSNTVISVFPNPTSNSVNVVLPAGTKSGSEIQLYDVYGQKLRSIIVSDNQTVIDLSEMASGVYFLKVINDDKLQGTAFVTKQ